MLLMRIVPYYSILVFCLVGLVPDSSNADTMDYENYDEEESAKHWINLGFGGTFPSEGLGDADGGLSVGMTFSYLKWGHLISARALTAKEIKINLFGNSGPRAGIWDIGFLYGRILKRRLGLVSISGGISLVGISDGVKTTHHFGFPLDTQLFFTPSASFGMGIYGYANINSANSFIGMLFCFQIGGPR
jgi:hypothetical protein